MTADRGEFQIRSLTAAELGQTGLALIRDLRGQAWREVQTSRPKSAELDEVDAVAIHFVALVGAAIVGSARVSLHESRASLPEANRYPEFGASGLIASINRMVVKPAWQRKGVAAALDAARLAYIDALRVEFTVVHAWSPRDTVLKALGFVEWATVDPVLDASYGFEARPGSVVMRRWSRT